MSVLSDIDLTSVGYVCANLRECNAAEIFPVRPHDSPFLLAWEVCAAIRRSGRGQVIWHAGKPAIVAGFIENWPGCWSIMVFGTNDFRAAAVDALRWVRRTVRDLREHHGARRLQSETREGDTEAAAFFKALGAWPEGPPMRRYGKDGSAFQRYVWFAGANDGFAGQQKEHANVL